MIRRTFLQLTIASLIAHKISFAQKVDKIISVKIDTKFNLEPIFTSGDLRIIENVADKPLFEITVDYESGKTEKFESNRKIWTQKESHSKIIELIKFEYREYLKMIVIDFDSVTVCFFNVKKID